MPGFLYCIKYPGFDCLHCAGKSICELYREQSRLLLMLSNCSRAYFGVFFDWCATTQTNEQTRVYICIALIVPFRSHLLTCSAMIGRLCIIHVISQTTLDVLGNINSTYGRTLVIECVTSPPAAQFQASSYKYLNI